MKGRLTVDGWTDKGTRTTFKISSHFPVRADKDRQPILRQMKHHQMSLDYPKSLQ